MGELRYPAVVIDHGKLRGNIRIIADTCEQNGILFCGVVKCANGHRSVIEDFVAGGAKMLASSRMEHLMRCREVAPEIPRLLIRLPMISEVSDVIEYTDLSLNTEEDTLLALNEEALKRGKIHKVILMADLGDLREGFFDHDELVSVVVKIENELKGLRLVGVGTNLGCYGSVMPTEDKMVDLANIAERVEGAIGRRLEIVSGGATSSLMAVYDKYMPGKINMLRIGAACYCGPLEDLRLCYGCTEMDDLSDDSFTLEAEVIEVKKKASHPIGTLGVDAFGKKGVYVDRGDRMRALLAVGRADYGDIGDLIPTMEGVEVIGASGDHTILDIEDAKEEIKVGDIIRFKLRYTAILRLTASENVKVHERSI